MTVPSATTGPVRLRFQVEAEPIVDDDATIRAAVADADPVVLLVATAHLTGDTSLLQRDLRPDPAQLLTPGAGLGPDQQERACDRAAAALAAHRDRDGAAPRRRSVDADELRALIGFMVGDAVVATDTDADDQDDQDDRDTQYDLLREELALDGDLRAPDWRIEDVAPGRTVRVGIIGCGISGIVTAHRLRQVGADVVVYEKNEDVGGTWFENQYPGCRVDVPSSLYSFSFLQSGDWPQEFASQEVLLAYFRAAVDELGLRSSVRFGTEVLGASYDETTQQWQVETRDTGSDHVDLLVSAVGQLNQPSLPDIAGRDRFAGPWFHSARWRHDIDLSGRRVAIIGTGASAAQFIPAVAEVAERTTVYQRTPPWLLPTPGYHEDHPPGLGWVRRHLPDYARWDRLWTFWRMQEGLLPAAVVDPDWWAEHPHSVSDTNELLRLLLDGYLAMEFPDPELLERVRPTYPPLAKRIVRDDGAYSRALRRDDVELVVDGIAEITETGVRTDDGTDGTDGTDGDDGTERPADVIIYGTGFRASEFLTPMRVVGRDGVDLRTSWDGDARAHLGLTVPGYPNLFLLYGPNTNIVANGSIIFFSECGARYITDCLRLLLDGGRRALECRPARFEAFNRTIDELNRQRAWGVSDVNTWYRNARGRTAQNWPLSLSGYWQQTRRVDPGDFDWT